MRYYIGAAGLVGCRSARSGMPLGTRMRGQRIWPRGITVRTIANVSEEAELGSLFFQNTAYVGGTADAFQILGGWARPERS